MSASTLRQRPAGAAANSPGLVSVDGKRFTLRSACIAARAEGGLAESRLIQSYANPYDEPLEVIYTLPLPADGAVVGYTITLGERVITGEIETLEGAREAYTRALEEGRTAGLLEQVRADTFTQKLGSLPAGATARIEVRVLHPLAFIPFITEQDASWEYRFPTVASVRYEGASGRVRDAEDLDVDRADGGGTPVRLDLDLVLADGGPDELQPHSSSHSVRVEAAGPGCRLRLDEAAPLDRDLVVRWQAAAADVDVRLVEGPGLPGDDGRYGLLTITPPLQPKTTLARDVTVLIDASGSMSGFPLESCKRIVESVLDSLGPQDRLEILAFSDSVRKLVAGPVNATPARLRAARKLLGELQAGGGTEMTSAMVEALQSLRDGSQRQVILLTDGYIGFEREVIGEVLRTLPAGCRIHAVGVGSAPNRTLTRGVARAGRGAEIFIDSPASVAAAAQQLLRATVGPVLTELSIAGSACRGAAPSRLPDMLCGRPLVAAVELQPQGGSLEVRGRLAGSREPWVRTLEVAPHDAAGGRVSPLPIGALFGRESVEDRELQQAAADPDECAAFEDEIETLGLHHRITTRRTSLVAISEEPTVDPSQPRRRQRLAVELPAGVSAEHVGLMPQMLVASASVRGAVGYQAPTLEEVHARMPHMWWHFQAAPEYRSREYIQPDASDLQGLIHSRITRHEGDLLVIEFESPADGFALPQPAAQLDVKSIDGDAFSAEVVGSLSTQPGPHDAALTLRLGLRRVDGRRWPMRELWITWTNVDGREVVVLVEVP